MARLSRNQLNKLKEQLGVKTLWSFSRYNSYKTDPYGYYLNYIRHIKPEETDSIYSFMGGSCHDIIEAFYNDNITNDEMVERFESVIFEKDVQGFKYPGDKDKQALIARNYEDSIYHFFENYKRLNGKLLTEKFLTINVGGFWFQGYIDAISLNKDTNTVTIYDWKTSTIYKGDKAIKESKQLLLYAKGVSDKFNIPLENIKACWNFLKYCEVWCDLKTVDKKTGLRKQKMKICQRNKWIEESVANVKTWLREEYGFEKNSIEEATAFQEIQEDNSFRRYPKIEEHFRLEDCYVYIDINEDTVKELCDDIENVVGEIVEKTKKTKELMEDLENNEDEIDKLWWVEVNKGNEFFFKNLCGYSRHQHKPFDKYLQETEELFNISTKDNDTFEW